MDEVQKFIEDNKHQLGYIMQEASRQWKMNDINGALTVGACNAFVMKHGDYHEVLDKKIEYELALKEVITNYGRISPLGLLEIVQKALKS